jgi:hypothetical protein
MIPPTTTNRGAVAHIYQPSGWPQYGSVASEQEGDVVTDPVSRPWV